MILFLAVMLLAATCVGCGKQPQNDDVLFEHQEQGTNLPSVVVPQTDPDVGAIENPATGDGLFEISKETGTVVEFSDSGCSITPTHYDGNVAYEAAPGHEDQTDLTTVSYSEDCIFQIAYVNMQTGKATYENATVDDVKKQTRIVVCGEYDDSNILNATHIFIYRKMG